MENYQVKRYTLASSFEVDQVVDQIARESRSYILAYIGAFIHNTVTIQNLIHQLTKTFGDAIEIVTVKTERNKENHILVYSYDDTLTQEQANASGKDLILYHFEHACSNLQAELLDTKQQMVQRYFVDSLTNLPNLYQLRQDLQETEACSFVILNVDNFKLLNDFYGFMVGDFILENISMTLQEIVNDAQIYRMSGDEFALLLPEKMDFYRLKDYMGELSLKLQNLRFNYDGTTIYVDLTLASSASKDETDIFSKVGMALKYAKEMRLPFWIYEDRMHFEHEYENNLKIATKVRRAIELSGITPYFQPILSNKTGRIEKFECLSRLEDEEGSILSPNMFISIAKTIKVYNQVTKAVIDKAFERFADNTFDFSINLSIEDVMSHEMYEFIIDKLQTTGMGHRVIFELLESEAVEDYKKVSRFITEVKRYGARIAIDDFGSGFSNFVYLTRLDVDFIKIDGSLISDIDTNPNSYAITETIVAFAKKMGIATIAEFVHSSTVMAKVRQLDVDFSQGYHIDEPKPSLNSELVIA